MADNSGSTSKTSGTPTPKQTSGKTQAKSMAELMSSYKTSFQTFKKGDLIKGTITKLTKNEILVDVHAKTQAVVLEKDRTLLNNLLAMLKTGDEVEVSVLNPESDMGFPVVSLRRFLSNAAWKQVEDAKTHEKQLSVTVTDVTKGGVIVVLSNGLVGFLPNSHMSNNQTQSVGKQINVRPIEINRKENKIIFSQKQNIPLQVFEEALVQFKVGDTVEATVANVVPFGVFATVSVPGMKNAQGEDLLLDALVHISELSWEKTDDISSVYTSGQKIQAKIIAFDKEMRRIDLSVKQLTRDPFEEIISKYPLDSKISGKVIRVDDNGVYLELEEGIEGVIRKDKIPPTLSFNEGQNINATVSEVDKKRHKIYLIPVLLEKPLMYR